MPTLRRSAVLLAAALLAPALPSLAAPAPVSVVTPVVRDALLSLGTTTASLAGERLVGVTWESGAADVRARWLTPAGWTAWQRAEQDTGDADAETVATRPGTEPLWRPDGATAAQVEVTGTARGLRLVRVSDGAARTSRSWGASPASASTATGLLGEVASRADWGADESLRRGSPSYASRVSAVVVHHTAGRNGYSAGRGALDHPGRLRLPRAVARLVRPRLQPRRRPLRPGLAGPGRRGDPGDRRGARPGLQHRHARRLGPG